MTSPAHPRRRWFSYSLRTFFVVVTIFGVWLGVACSPKLDPGGMRVFRALLGKEILDETDATQS